jgi:hypothetical protein
MPHFITLPVNEKGIVFEPQIDDSIPNGAPGMDGRMRPES